MDDDFGFETFNDDFEFSPPTEDNREDRSEDDVDFRSETDEEFSESEPFEGEVEEDDSDLSDFEDVEPLFF